MSDRTHYEGCWRHHHACAVARVDELEAEVQRLSDRDRTGDPEQGWCPEHPLRLQVSTARHLPGGYSTEDGDDLCLACEIDRLTEERDEARAQAARAEDDAGRLAALVLKAQRRRPATMLPYTLEITDADRQRAEQWRQSKGPDDG